MNAVHDASSSSSGDLSPNWAGHLEHGLLQLIGSKLEHPYVPGTVHLARICRAWRAAAEGARGISISWYSRQLVPGEEQEARQQEVLRSLNPWFQRMGRQVASLEIVSQEAHGGADLLAVYVAFNSFAKAAAAAGKPLRMERLGFPLTPSLSLPPPAQLAAALPFLRHLSVPVDIELVGCVQGERAAFFRALGGLRHLSSLEVGLRTSSPFHSPEQFTECWEQLLEAAPKQLQQLSVRVTDPSVYDDQLPPAEVVYTCEPLEPFTQLQRLELGSVAAGCDLSPLTQLQSLKRLGIKQKDWDDANLQQLLPVKELLQDLKLGYTKAADEEHLQQLTTLTALTTTGGLYVACPLPQQVAAGLQRLEWGLYDNSNSKLRPANSSMAGQELAKCSSSGSGSGGGSSSGSSSSSSGGGDGGSCSGSRSSSGNSASSSSRGGCGSSSSSKLRELKLVGDAWTRPSAAAGEALRHLTGLTSFAFGSKRRPGAAANDWGTWSSQPPMQHLKQLRSLALPVELLATEQLWLGGLGHLTRLRLEVEWSGVTATGTWRPEQVLGSDQAKVLANLRSCSTTLKVMEVDLLLLYPEGMSREEALPVVPAVKAWFKRQVPGVYLVFTWHADMDMDEEEMWAMMDDWAQEDVADGWYDGEGEGEEDAVGYYVPSENPEAYDVEGEEEQEGPPGPHLDDDEVYYLTEEDMQHGYEVCMEDLEALRLQEEQEGQQ
jgi:hypothetical protein